jgi:ABC-type lipoprotein release transport system permease subunit
MIGQLALRNILGAGLRTWLNVLVLSIAFVSIIATHGLFIGMGEQVTHAMVDAECGGGQYWQKDYDPYDRLSIRDAHGVVPGPLKRMIEEELATPVLVLQGTLFPKGRIQPVLLKGIDPDQKILSIPSRFLDGREIELPALIGQRMAQSTGLKTGDWVTIRWRDANGTFDARDIRIVQVMKTSVQSIDLGQIWLPLKTIQLLSGMEGEASYIVTAQTGAEIIAVPDWNFKSVDYLLADVKALVQNKTVGSSILYAILIALAMLAIFNSQVLSIFKRKREMGTLMALGFTRQRVIHLFTLEGTLHSVLAALVAAVYGIPLLTHFAQKGWIIPQAMDSYGFAIGEKLFPSYSAGLIVGTALIVLVTTTIVSFLPTRKITKLEPTVALRGRLK